MISATKLTKFAGFKDRQRMSRRDWNWKELASWIDAEGCLICREIRTATGTGRNCEFSVVQDEKEVLDSLCKFVERKTGKHCGVARSGSLWRAGWGSKKAVSETIRRTEQYIRTVKKKKTVWKSKGILANDRYERKKQTSS